MDGKKVVAKKLLGIPLTQKEQAFYEMFLQGNEKEILKGMVWPSLWKNFIFFEKNYCNFGNNSIQYIHIKRVHLCTRSALP